MKGIVGISSVPWDYLPIAPQQTLKFLAQRQPVLFVERQTSVAGFLLDREKANAAYNGFREGLREVGPQLFVLTPPPAAPWCSKSSSANKISMSLLSFSAVKAAKKLSFDQPVVIAYYPQAYMLEGNFNESCFVYDVIDEYSAFPNMNVAMCKSFEEKICRQADLVFAISENLLEERKAFNPQTFHLPIGAETDRFVEAAENKKNLDVFSGVSGRKIGYYGSIDDRLNVDFCLAAAKAMPEHAFFFFGPVRGNASIAALQALKNTYFPGPVDYSVLADYAVHFDIAVLPYTKSRFNKYIFPNKIFEYLATGAPVVTSDIPSIRYLEREEFIRIARTPEEYVEALEAALKDTETGRDERIACARANTWQNRADKLWEEVLRFLEDGE